VALDGTRLYQDTQRRAARERLAGEITGRIRETLDVETVLKTAIREMGAALGIPKVEVRLGGAVIQPLSPKQTSGNRGEGVMKGDDHVVPD
jgi:hypothetical protein